MHWLISKFISIAKKVRFISKKLDKIIIEDDIIEQEKEIFTEILYNREAILVWDFIEMRKVKKKITLS